MKTIVSAAILTAVLCISGNLLAYSGGNGSAGRPYQIANVADFQQLSATPTDWSLSFILTANIKLPTSPAFTQAPIAPDTDSATSDFQGTQFTGVFDGNGCVIGYLTITAPAKDYIGLFGYVGSGGQIRNLGVKNIDITGRNFVGGLVGKNHGDMLTECYATGSVTGTGNYLGGLVGLNYSGGMLTSCYAIGSVSGTNSFVGGMVGRNDGTLTSCYATESVSGNYYIGGMAGENEGTLIKCYATGSVTGTNYVGGLVGVNYYAILTSCYAIGSVGGTGNYLGGLVGDNYESTVTDCYATGLVSGTDYVGGLVGANNGSLTACFWDTQTSGQTVGVGDGTSTGVTGKSTEAMKTLATFTSAGWDFINVWAIGQNQTYPYLQTQPSADLNYDGMVNLVDFAIFAGQWLEGV